MFMQGGDEQSRRDEHWWEERKRKKTDYQTDVERDKQTDKRDKQTDKQEELEWNQGKTVVRHDELKDGQNHSCHAHYFLNIRNAEIVFLTNDIRPKGGQGENKLKWNTYRVANGSVWLRLSSSFVLHVDFATTWIVSARTLVCEEMRREMSEKLFVFFYTGVYNESMERGGKRH